MTSGALREPAHAGIIPVPLRLTAVPPDEAGRLSTVTGLNGYAWERLGDGAAPTVFYRGTGPKKSVFLKKIPCAHKEVQLFGDSIARWAFNQAVSANKMLPGFPVPYGAEYALFGYAWHDGEYYSRWDEGRFVRLGRELGRLHKALKTFPELDAVKGNKATFIAGLDAIRRDLAGGEKRTPFFAEDIRKIAAESSFDLPGMSSPVLIHGDINPGNVLFSDDRLVLLDFEHSRFCFFPPELELSFVLERFMLIHGAWSPERVQRFLASYVSGGGEVTALDDACIIRNLRWLRLMAFCRLQQAQRLAPGEWTKMIALWTWINGCEKNGWMPFISAETV